MLKKPFYDKIYMLVKKKEALTEMVKDNLGKDYVEIFYNVSEFPSVDTFQDSCKTNKVSCYR